MNKQEYLARLGKGLSGLPKQDIEERLTFYGDMIDERMEDGVPEEAAVLGTGDVDVPKTATGGRCEIVTDTGDIHITVK